MKDIYSEASLHSEAIESNGINPSSMDEQQTQSKVEDIQAVLVKKVRPELGGFWFFDETRIYTKSLLLKPIL
jgi:hypothetical protein